MINEKSQSCKIVPTKKKEVLCVANSGMNFLEKLEVPILLSKFFLLVMSLMASILLLDTIQILVNCIIHINYLSKRKYINIIHLRRPL
jgi:uncharacterized membrane protein